MRTRRGDCRLPSGGRLRHSVEFDKVYRDGRRLVSPFFVAFVLERSAGPLRVGVVASRRVGGAVERNRAKRLLREVFRRHKPERSVSADIVLVARAEILRAGYDAVEGAYVRGVGRFIEKLP